MNERVIFNCRVGDVIFFRDDEGWARNARIVSTWPNGVRVQFSDEERQDFPYETLAERGATYVAKCEPVLPEGFRLF